MSWKVTLPCTRNEAEELHHDDEWLAALEPMPTIVADEVEAFNDEKWRLEAYFNEKPNAQVIAAIQIRLPSAVDAKAVVEELYLLSATRAENLSNRFSECLGARNIVGVMS